MAATGLACVACGTELPPNSKFCNECGAAVSAATELAEYKQATVLFADVVRSMEIAAAMGAERLSEIMTELVTRSSAVVQRYGGTVDRFTGDGVMAVFGAPIALEDHAFRACLAALVMQDEAARLADQIQRRDGVDLRLRIGLNSGQVISGHIGSSAFDYTAIGEHVGMAQRMESAAPAGGVLLSESTARLVEDAAVLAEPEMVHIKGANDPVVARRLLATTPHHQHSRRNDSPLVGRTWELKTIAGILDEAVGGAGCVLSVRGSPGIGKSRIVRESAALAGNRGMAVSVSYCESHTSDIAFHAVAGLLRAALGVDDLDNEAARARVRSRIPYAAPDDLLLLDDLLSIADPDIELSNIEPDARRRRLTALVNAASVARRKPALYVIEDAHWIDAVSESMLAELLAVIPQTHSMVIITYRPDYRGPLATTPEGRTVALRPLSTAQTAALIAELLGTHSSVHGLAEHIVERAAGNPFFAEEIVRDLAERGAIRGTPGSYQLYGDVAEISVPETLQAAIAARVDRLSLSAKRTLSAAAVIGSRFDTELLTAVVDSADVTALVEAELVNQVKLTPPAEYAFHHPLVRSVAYESQLKSQRSQIHRRLAAAIEVRGSADENAALIAEHLEAAGDLQSAFVWHMRAGTWLNFRDIAAAQTSWRRARQVADRLPKDDPERMSMRIAPLTLSCGTAWRVRGRGAETSFNDLRQLCTATGDQRSLATGMAGLVAEHYQNARRREASRLASELGRLLESIADPTLTVALSFTAMLAKQETGEMAELLRLAQRVIDLADGDPDKGNLVFPSPLTFAIGMRGVARWCVGIAGWKDDFHEAMAMARERATDPTILAGVMWFTYPHAIPYGVLLPDATAMRDTAEFMEMAEQFGDNLALEIARAVRGIVLVDQDGSQREAGLDLLEKVRDKALSDQFALIGLPIVDIHIAQEKARLGDVDGAIELARTVADDLFDSGGSIWSALASRVWWKRFCAAPATKTSRMLTPRSTDWPPCRLIRGSCSTTFSCCECRRCLRSLGATR